MKCFRQKTTALIGLSSSILGYSYSAYALFPQYFKAEPILILGVDSLIFTGGCVILISVFTTALFSILQNKVSLGIGTSAELYRERLLDFNRRLAFYRCTYPLATSYGDDYWGDRILDLTDYRAWIRRQQEKKSEAKRNRQRFKLMNAK